MTEGLFSLQDDIQAIADAQFDDARKALDRHDALERRVCALEADIARLLDIASSMAVRIENQARVQEKLGTVIATLSTSPDIRS